MCRVVLHALCLKFFGATLHRTYLWSCLITLRLAGLQWRIIISYEIPLSEQGFLRVGVRLSAKVVFL